MMVLSSFFCKEMSASFFENFESDRDSHPVML